MHDANSIIKQIMDHAGVKINGKNPWDIQVHDNRFFSRVLYQPELGLGESYMDGWWDCQQLDELFYRCIRADIKELIETDKRFLSSIFVHKFKSFLTHIINFQSKKRAWIVGKKHYDISNDLYQAMLDKKMMYSCGYWKDATDLEEAQTAKLELICRKLQLQPGMTLLDIGCGWGGLAKYAAEKYGVSVVGCTVSEQQFNFAKVYCEGLPIEIKLQDYRDMSGKFDRICSVGMFEHVGYKNYPKYMEVAYRSLNEGGLFLLHTIGGNQSVTHGNSWIDKYIFPNSMLPSVKQVGGAIEKLFVMEDWHSFGAHYDKTAMSWHKNFIQYWEHLKKDYDERFRRMWEYNLLLFAGAFRARDLQLWQIVLSKKGVLGGYVSVR